MPFDRPSLSEIISRIKSDYNTYVDNSSTFLRRSFYDVTGKIFGGAHHLQYDYLEYVKDQLFIMTADLENLKLHGAEYGIYLDSGTKSTGSIVASGTAGTSIPAGTQLQSTTGNNYIFDSTVNIGAGGTVTTTITASSSGVASDEDSGTVLSFVSPIANVNSTCTVAGSGLTGGENEETEDEYRTRILNRKRKPPHGGIAQDYENWALEYTGVTRAWAIEQYYGIGTVGLVVIMDNEDDIFPDETTRNAIKDYINSHTDPTTGKTVGTPVTAKPGFIIIDAEPRSVNLTLQLDPNTSAMQTLVTSNLNDAILQYAGPGETVALSQLYEAITTTTGEIKSKITAPTDDITTATNQVHVAGTYTFQDYA